MNEWLLPTQTANSTPFYRLLYRWASPAIHHWTTDPNEVATLTGGPNWLSEGITGYLLAAPSPQLQSQTEPYSAAAARSLEIVAADVFGMGQAVAENEDGTPNGEGSAALRGSVVTLQVRGRHQREALQIAIGGWRANVVDIEHRGALTLLKVRVPDNVRTGAAVVSLSSGPEPAQGGVFIHVQ